MNPFWLIFFKWVETTNQSSAFRIWDLSVLLRFFFRIRSREWFTLGIMIPVARASYNGCILSSWPSSMMWFLCFCFCWRSSVFRSSEVFGDLRGWTKCLEGERKNNGNQFRVGFPSTKTLVRMPVRPSWIFASYPIFGRVFLMGILIHCSKPSSWGRVEEAPGNWCLNSDSGRCLKKGHSYLEVQDP